ncbi:MULTISPECIES: ABC transporter permease [unclassified Bacillus (in: firmicutes)]|uniref:ABC transporter permease n=1 Tax=unclassified Bacillus (in: firmicutes) TaxID=185979 RepID=UPI0008EBCA88|nr:MULTISPECIES: ABC transporter permease [unclassified Bacillus (in: firmicutes)]SFJ28184.1 ABC-2 family transporter protein [Bacillus sp. 71mf]SFS54342.1 ABC-2 family transporter protein [Bacillus sp. 103mf]
MLHLTKLEMKKFRIGWYVKGAFLANIIITAVFISMNYIQEVENDVIMTNAEEAFLLIGAMVRATFIVFAAVLLAQLVIEEYKNKTIILMFSYPVKRKKLIASKLCIVAILTCITILLSNIVVTGAVFFLHGYFSFISYSITFTDWMKQTINMIPFAIAAAGTSLIPLYFGMRKYSVPVTIVSSLFVVSFACSYNPGFSMVMTIPIQFALAAVGILIAYLAIRDIEKEDAI